MASRIGRKYASHTYPQSPGAGGGGAVSAFARNYAQGPAAGTLVEDASGGIVFSIVEGGGGATPNVPITPRVTGLILVEGTIECSNTKEDADQLTVQIVVDGTPVAHPITGNYVNGGVGQVTSVSFALVVGPLTIGTTHHVRVVPIENSPGDLQLDALDSTLTLQEVAAATG